MSTQSPTTLAVANQKGGVAKTTSVASIGAALAAYHLFNRQPRVVTDQDGMRGSYLGPMYEQHDIERRLGEAGAKFAVLDDAELLDTYQRRPLLTVAIFTLYTYNEADVHEFDDPVAQALQHLFHGGDFLPVVVIRFNAWNAMPPACLPCPAYPS